jgi:type I restriction-modification system DNA methylase subunit
MPVLSQQQLQAHLWESANILLGSIDSSDYKNYIFGMLFLKRLSDVFDDEVQAVIERESADRAPPDEARRIAEDPDEHQFYVPERARWSNIRAKTFNIGEAIYKAFFELEERNRALAGVLTPIDFNNKERLPDVTLLKLIAHFNKVRLGHADIPNPDMLGDAYMYLIAQFADDAGKKGGEFYTPRQVVRLIVELLKPTEGMVICDPTAGSGGMLLESLCYVRESGGNPRNVRLFGQKKNLNTWAICKMNMLLHRLPDVAHRAILRVQPLKFNTPAIGAQLKEDGWLIPGTNNLTVQRRIRGIPIRLWQLKADFMRCDDCVGGSLGGRHSLLPRGRSIITVTGEPANLSQNRILTTKYRITQGIRNTHQ